MSEQCAQDSAQTAVTAGLTQRQPGASVSPPCIQLPLHHPAMKHRTSLSVLHNEPLFTERG